MTAYSMLPSGEPFQPARAPGEPLLTSARAPGEPLLVPPRAPGEPDLRPALGIERRVLPSGETVLIIAVGHERRVITRADWKALERAPDATPETA